MVAHPLPAIFHIHCAVSSTEEGLLLSGLRHRMRAASCGITLTQATLGRVPAYALQVCCGHPFFLELCR